MKGETARLDGAAAKLRSAFDVTFSEAPIELTVASEDCLFVRIGNDPFAIRLAETAGLYADRKVVPIPSPVPDLLGVAALRGQLTPIYDLAALLGYRVCGSPRWFVLAREPKAIGLAFEAFEAHARIPQTSYTSVGTESTREHVRGAVQVGPFFRPIIHISSVIQTIAKRADTATSSK
jgi:chemotaxis signal transduction protein